MASTSSDVQTWVYPPGGAANPPIASTANFGPVHYGDSMVLNWTPGTTPDVAWQCFSQAGYGTGYYAVRGQTPPYTYKFNQIANSTGPTDPTFCHFYFLNSVMGNTVVFEYNNTALSQATTWGAAQISSSSTSTRSATATSSISVSSSSAVPLPSSSSASITATSATTSPTTASTNISEPASAGLSSGAQAGIGIGVALAVLAVLAIGALLLFRKRKQQKAAGASAYGQPMSEMDGAAAAPYPEKVGYHEKEVRPAELGQGGYNHTSELGVGGREHPSELP